MSEAYIHKWKVAEKRADKWKSKAKELEAEVARLEMEKQLLQRTINTQRDMLIDYGWVPPKVNIISPEPPS